MSFVARRAITGGRSYARLNTFRPSTKRFASQTSFQPSLSSHILAGVFGGLAVIGAGYGYYHFSGIKQAVDASKRARVYLQETKESFTKKYPNHALEYLRKVSKGYVAVVPGAEVIVDQAFDSVENVVEAHGEEANIIMTAAYDEIRDVTLQNGEREPTLAIAMKVMAILRRRLGELQALGTKAGAHAVKPLRDLFPEGAEKIGERLDELKGLASGMGSEGRRVLDDVQNQAKAIFSAGVSSEKVKRASSLIKEKTSKLRKDATDESLDEQTTDE